MYVADNVNTERFEIAPTAVADHFYEQTEAFDISAGSGVDDGHQGILLSGENHIRRSSRQSKKK